MNILITGCSSGIGRAATILLAERGYNVFAGSRDKSRLKELDAMAAENGWSLHTLTLDVTDDASVQKAIESMDELGGVDVLVNNAGYALIGPLEEIPLDEVRKQLDTNLLGPIRMIQSVLPQMRRRGSGRIINVSSVAGQISFPYGSPYCTSKFALEGLSDSLRIELSPYGVKVILVEPGATKTNINEVAARHYEKIVKGDSPYYGSFRRAAEKFDKIISSGTEPEAVAKVILKAIEAKQPRARYQVNLSGTATLLVKRFLPQFIIDEGTRARFNFHTD